MATTKMNSVIIIMIGFFIQPFDSVLPSMRLIIVKAFRVGRPEEAPARLLCVASGNRNRYQIEAVAATATVCARERRPYRLYEVRTALTIKKIATASKPTNSRCGKSESLAKI